MTTRTSLLGVVLVLGSLTATGCATKGYVRQQVQPVGTKVDQVAQQTDQQGTQLKQTGDKLDQTSQQVQQNQEAISATREVADSADSRSTNAMNLGNQNKAALAQLQSSVANLDAYKVSDQATVLFAFNRHQLTAGAKAQLDQLAAKAQGEQRYFITVEGYTDQTGSASYNDALSRERANSVIMYLVGQGKIPVYRIHMIGLGEQDLINGGRTRDDRAQSRRVDIAVYTAPALPAANTQ